MSWLSSSSVMLSYPERCCPIPALSPLWLFLTPSLGLSLESVRSMAGASCELGWGNSVTGSWCSCSASPLGLARSFVFLFLRAVLWLVYLVMSLVFAGLLTTSCVCLLTAILLLLLIALVMVRGVVNLLMEVFVVVEVLYYYLGSSSTANSFFTRFFLEL